MKNSWKVVLIVAAGIIAVILLCVLGVQSSQNRAFSLEEQVNTADSDIKVQEKRRVDLVYNLADCVKQYDRTERRWQNYDSIPTGITDRNYIYLYIYAD